MRLRRALQALASIVLTGGALLAQAQVPAVVKLQVQARAGVAELVCAPREVRRPAPSAAGDEEPPGPPDAEEVNAQLAEAATGLPALPSTAARVDWSRAVSGQALRVAFWGDSHLAAGFFTDELARLSGLAAHQIAHRYVGANMNRAGVRLRLRKSCVDGRWQYEPAHARPPVSTGPGLVSLSSAAAGAALAWDLRDADGVPQHTAVHLLYEQAPAPVWLSVQVDLGEPQTVQLPAGQGPAVLAIEGDAPLSVLQVQLLSGAWRWQGLSWPLPSVVRLQLDVFGYPGATVAGWAQSDEGVLPDWWGVQPYDLVALEFGTNEGNVQPFDAARYEAGLRQAVGRWRARFAQAACVLIGPGDRGVLVRKSARQSRAPSGKKAKTKGSQKLPPVAAAPKEDLLRYTRIHLLINRVQQQVAAEHGCRFWSMFSPMGGAGGAYRWVAQKPALMARDLIHFTVPGYQRLAQDFARDLGWGPQWFGEPSSMTAPMR